MLLIFLLPFSRDQAKILNINYAKHQKRMSTSQGLNMHVPSVALTNYRSIHVGVLSKQTVKFF